MLKKKMAAVLAGAACLSVMAFPVSAASTNESSQTELGTNFTFEYKNDPTYAVTIPSEVTIEKEGTDVSIEVSNVANLDGKKVSVTIAGTDAFCDQMVLEGKTESGSNASIRYYFLLEDGSRIETKPDNVNGTEITSFTEDGKKEFTVHPVLTGSSSIKKGVTYTGSMTY